MSPRSRFLSSVHGYGCDGAAVKAPQSADALRYDARTRHRLLGPAWTNWGTCPLSASSSFEVRPSLLPPLGQSFLVFQGAEMIFPRANYALRVWWGRWFRGDRL